MMIEGLIADPRRRGSTRVAVSGRVAWTVPNELIAALGLVEGSQVTSVMITQLEAGADEEGALRAGLRALERRGHAERELSGKLERRGHLPLAVAAAVRRLKSLGLIDDAEFAKHYVRSRADRGRGPMRLRHDLSRLGVPAEAIEAALALQADSGSDPLARARGLVSKRAARMVGLSRETRRRRLSAFLARRGFQGDERKRLVDEVLSAGV